MQQIVKKNQLITNSHTLIQIKERIMNLQCIYRNTEKLSLKMYHIKLKESETFKETIAKAYKKICISINVQNCYLPIKPVPHRLSVNDTCQQMAPILR